MISSHGFIHWSSLVISSNQNHNHISLELVSDLILSSSHNYCCCHPFRTHHHCHHHHNHHHHYYNIGIIIITTQSALSQGSLVLLIF